MFTLKLIIFKNNGPYVLFILFYFTIKNIFTLKLNFNGPITYYNIIKNEARIIKLAGMK